MSEQLGRISIATNGNGVYCRDCGATPAAPIQIRGHRGLIVYMKFLTAHGPFCRDCGLATYRRMTVENVWLGWWGAFSMAINPITIMINLTAHQTLQQLPPPIPGSPGQPADPGKPLLRRRSFIAFLALFALFCSISPILSILTLIKGDRPEPHPTPMAGQCVRGEGSRGVSDLSADLAIVRCDDSRAEAKVLARASTNPGPSACAAYSRTDLARTSLADQQGPMLCLLLLGSG
ncbi:LppU/SCO3897 family protein [Nocardia jejuensis]|uniref:LppU/SCO3897 family protein n=1 Tax=Nocardia jejuensis TaxID=328049 RepID=UPI000835E73C|nr:hypothetical protein [Nocardia jejuensis]